jgi:hypothetical protein
MRGHPRIQDEIFSWVTLDQRTLEDRQLREIRKPVTLF